MTEAKKIALREPVRAVLASIVAEWDALAQIEQIIGREIDSKDVTEPLMSVAVDVGGGTCTWPNAKAVPDETLDEFIAEVFDTPTKGAKQK